MAEKKVIELEVSSNLGNLKQQLKQAQVEVQNLSEKFGATSAAAVEAAKKAAILKDKIGDAKALTDAFNPDAKFKALSSSLTGVAGGFSVVTGALGAFGKQNEDVEKALLKVQSAMAIASGAQAIGESIDSFKQLGAVLKANTIVQRIMTAAQYAYNLAMSLNPIGAIIAATIALIAAGYGLIKMFQASTEATAKNESAVKKNDAALKQQIKSSERASEALKTKNGHEYEMAKASGASTKALRALALKHAEEEVALNKASLATAKNTYEKNKNTLANLINSDASDELIEKQREITIESRKASAEERKDLEESEKNKTAIIRKNAVEVQQEITDKNTKLKESNKTHNDAIKQQNEEAAKVELERIKTLNENIASLNEEIRVSNLTDQEKEVDAINKKYTKLIEEGKKAKIDVSKLEEEKRLGLAAITKKYDNEDSSIRLTNSQSVISNIVSEGTKRLQAEKAIGDKSREQLKTSLAEQTALRERNLKFIIESMKQILSITQDLATMSENKYKEINDKVLANENLTTAQKEKAIIKNNANAKKAFELNKKFQIASTLISTFAAARDAYKSQFLPPDISSPIRGGIAAGIATAGGLVAVKKIMSTQFQGTAVPSGGDGGGGGATVPTMSAPQFNVVGQSGVNQLASLNQQPIQAYVVSGQVTSQQALDRNRLANATLGG
jgi:hypothetical protein